MNTPATIIHQANVLGHEFPIYGTAENPLFLAKDVANLIEHSDASKMMQTVDDDEKLMRTMFGSGQNRNYWFLTEYGLYEVLMQSRKPIAKQFKKTGQANSLTNPAERCVCYSKPLNRNGSDPAIS